ncbi:MAG: ester cyclase [Anaerolineae bacterium]|nr:ester cyclase [Anaerolineae bacterium]
MTSTDLKSTLRDFMTTIWNAGDFSNLSDYVSEQYTVKHDPGDAWDGQTIDRKTFIERVMYSRNAFPDLRFDIQEMVAEGQRVAAFWMMSGTHMGDLNNLPATGKPFKISGITIYDFDEDGKVCGHTQAYDRLGFIAQMGIING